MAWWLIALQTVQLVTGGGTFDLADAAPLRTTRVVPPRCTDAAPTDEIVRHYVASAPRAIRTQPRAIPLASYAMPPDKRANSVSKIISRPTPQMARRRPVSKHERTALYIINLEPDFPAKCKPHGSCFDLNRSRCHRVFLVTGWSDASGA